MADGGTTAEDFQRSAVVMGMHMWGSMENVRVVMNSKGRLSYMGKTMPVHAKAAGWHGGWGGGGEGKGGGRVAVATSKDPGGLTCVSFGVSRLAGDP